LEVLLLGMGVRLLGAFASSCRVLLSGRIYVVLLERRKRDSKRGGNIIYIRFLALLNNILT
jgi:hypothetical protein